MKRRKLSRARLERLNQRLRQSQGPDDDIERPYSCVVLDDGGRGVLTDTNDPRAAEF